MAVRVVACVALATWALVPARSADGQAIALRPGESVAPRFGREVAIAGDLLVVGAPGDDSAGEDVGAVYLHRRAEGGWIRTGRVVPPAGSVGSGGFGAGLALAPGLLMVGDLQPMGPLPAGGVVHVYEIHAGSGSSWVETLRPRDPLINAGFGGAIALEGRTALVGARGQQGQAELTGAAYVFVADDDGAWRQVAKLSAPDGAPRDGFGQIVALSGNIAAIGAPRHRSGGAVYLFEGGRSGRWRLTRKLEPPEDDGATGFGTGLALAGDRLVVGAVPGDPLTGADDAAPGAVFLYERGDGRTWRPAARLGSPRPSRGDDYGASVLLHGDVLAVGAPGADAMGRDSGAAYLYSWGRSGPELRARVATPAAQGGWLGTALAAAGDDLVVGAPAVAAGGGSVLAYDLADVLRPDRLRFDLLAHRSLGLPAAQVNALAHDPEGYLLLGTLGGGLAVFDGHRFRAHQEVGDDALSLSNDHVLALLVDRAGRTWVGTEDGLNRFDRRAGTFRRFRLGTPGRPQTEPVVALFEAADGMVWTGTRGRLYHHDPGADRFVEYEPFTGPPDDLDETYVSGIQQDSRGALWVLTKNLWENRSSLYRVDIPSRRVERFPVDPALGQVGPLLVDSRDRIWMKGPAPVRLSASGRVEPASEPLAASHWSFREDRQGTVWIGTRTGLYRVDPDTGGVTRHAMVPGVPDTASWNFVRALMEDPGGSLVVGTEDGAFRLASPARQPAARIVLSRLEVAGRAGSRVLRPAPGEAVKLSYEDYRLGFEFSALDYTGVRRYRYRYRLVGFDRGWIDAAGRPRASYTNVGPGNYRFQVEAEAADAAAAVPLDLSITIHPPFWGTTWFRSVIGLTILGTVVAFVVYRRRSRQAVERMRSRIAADLHDDLSTNLSGIALVSERLRREAGPDSAHGRQLGRVTETSRGMLEDLRDLVWLVDPQRDQVQDLVAKMRAVAETLLPTGSWNFSADAPEASELDMERRREVLRVYKEVLHNVHRHARAENVRIRIEARDGRLRVEIEDDGVGFDPGRHGQGHGLRSIQARAERLRGRVALDSEPGRGTRVVLDMPLP